MTVSTTTSRADYAGNGVTTAFTVPFYFLDSSHLLVLRTQVSTGVISTLTLGTDYSVTGAGVAAGGTVTMTAAPTSDQKLSILRNVPLTQLVHYVPNDPFPAATHEQALDQLTMEVQQVSEVAGRALTLPANTPSSGISTSLPTPSANKLIGWNANANGLQNVDAGTLATIVAYGTANADVFSGTGSQTVFALSANPGALNNLDVAISGVTQRPGIDYTWTSGTTLTFTSAPPAGTNNILVRYMRGLPQGASDSASASFFQAGTGAVQRTAQDKLREMVSVKDFGAVGDGVADDTLAIQSAATAAAGKTLLVSPGTYKVSSTITIPANTFVSGYGATFVVASQITVLSFTNGGGCLGLCISGPASGTYNANGVGIKCVGTNNAPSAPTFVYAPIIADCTITNFGSYGVFFGYVINGTVTRNTISGIGYAGVGGVSCTDTQVVNNNIYNIGPGPGNADSYGVFLDRYNGTSETAEPRSYRCNISYNSIRTVVATGGVNGQGVDTHGGVDFTILGNNIVGCQVGIAVTASSISGVQQLGSKRCTVDGNVIDGLSVGYGILISGAFNGSTVNEYTDQITVTNNVVLNHGVPNASGAGAIFMQGTKNCVVSGNTVKNSVSVGINLGLENKTISVSDNVITDPHDATFGAPCCIRVSGNNVTGHIGGNTFVYENGALDTYVAAESIRVAASLTGIDLDFARSTFIGIDATHLTAYFLSSGARYAGLFQDYGSSTISVASTGSNGITDVTFNKRFPYTPKIQVALRYPFNQGGKFPILGIDTSVAISATGFRIYAVPYDGATWTATGSLSFDWEAK